MWLDMMEYFNSMSLYTYTSAEMRTDICILNMFRMLWEISWSRFSLFLPVSCFYFQFFGGILFNFLEDRWVGVCTINSVVSGAISC